MGSMPTTNIYALCEPGTLTVRYVGITKHTIEQRAEDHYSRAMIYPESLKEFWIVQLAKSGQRPDCILLTTCSSDMARKVEKAWILLFIDNGYDMLNVMSCNGKGQKRLTRNTRPFLTVESA